MNDYVFIFDAAGDLQVCRSVADATKWAQDSDLVGQGHTGVFMADGRVLRPRSDGGSVSMLLTEQVALDRLVYRLSEYQRHTPTIPAKVDPRAYAEEWLAAQQA